MTITREWGTDYSKGEIRGSRHPCPGAGQHQGIWDFY